MIEAVDYPQKVKSVLMGVAVGDALGVPVEFRSREEIRRNPVTNMRGYGTYNQPPGTFSDDSSLTFCLAEALTGGYDLHAIARNFVKWKEENYWTARGDMFDIGKATSQAIGSSPGTTILMTSRNGLPPGHSIYHDEVFIPVCPKHFSSRIIPHNYIR